MQGDLDRILFDEATIHRRLDELATKISHDYRDRELTVVAILNGSVFLIADLLRRIPKRMGNGALPYFSNCDRSWPLGHRNLDGLYAAGLSQDFYGNAG